MLDEATMETRPCAQKVKAVGLSSSFHRVSLVYKKDSGISRPRSFVADINGEEFEAAAGASVPYS